MARGEGCSQAVFDTRMCRDLAAGDDEAADAQRWKDSVRFVAGLREHAQTRTGTMKERRGGRKGIDFTQITGIMMGRANGKFPSLCGVMALVVA